MLQQQIREDSYQLMNLIRSGSTLNIELALQLAKSQDIVLNLSSYTKLYTWLDYFVQGISINNPQALLEELFELEVLNLSLSQQKKIPPFIGLLSNLRVLILSLNNLTSLPKTIGQLVQLESLHLSHNKLKRLPSGIQNLQQLKTLKLGNNQIEKLPSSIFKIKNLEHLDLEYNQITRLPLGIGQLYKLKTLNLQHNPMIDLPQSLCSLTNLKKLVLPAHFAQKSSSIELINKLPTCAIQFGNNIAVINKQY
ncbi:MAG: leucine-rich repeat domain-containing protein [Aureispira sp.]|nr:leucine-rich repeat domain-containing protein [Aureispira sp.]